MYIPKSYGNYKIERCPFCSQQATVQNSQGVPVCMKHKKSVLENLKCACGDYLEIKTGKFGVYFSCMRCGNMNMRKVLELNEIKDVSEKSRNNKSEPDHQSPKFQRMPTEVEIRSDDPDYFD